MLGEGIGVRVRPRLLEEWSSSTVLRSQTVAQATICSFSDLARELGEHD